MFVADMNGMLAYVPQFQQGDFLHRAPLTRELDKPYVHFLIFAMKYIAMNLKINIGWSCINGKDN